MKGFERTTGRLFSVRDRVGRRSTPSPTPPPGPPVALVLSGGSVLGAIQVGQARALLEAGFVPELIVGCSVGSLNGVFLASRPDLERVAELEAIWTSLRSSDVFGMRSVRTLANMAAGKDYLCRPDALRQLIGRFCPVVDLADLPCRFEVVTTDLDSRTPAWWSTGPAVDLLLASAALPGVFPPVILGGHRHVDGGVLVPVPVARAIAAGAKQIFVCDVSARSRPRVPGRLGALATLLEAFDVARFALGPDPLPAEHQRVTVLPAPQFEGLSMMDFRHTRRLVDESYELAAEALASSVAA
ncbi:MAG TPA: patatin-like phospholipase family protein [Acidimicrobiales bacterium]